MGAFASPARFRMVLPIDLPDPELMQLILHELTHIFQYHMLFQGSLAKAVATAPPTWFMEGMASYMAKDETQRDKMYLRDAVVNDRIPSVSRGRLRRLLRLSLRPRRLRLHRGALGPRRASSTSSMRSATPSARGWTAPSSGPSRWSRRTSTSSSAAGCARSTCRSSCRPASPRDFGRIFRIEEDRTGGSEAISPVASPSGDLVAALTVYKGEVDVVLFDAKNRRLIRNLTRGFSSEYQYLIAQELAIGRKMGRDIAFSPDGNTIAVFAKREKGRSLLLDRRFGTGQLRTIIDMDGIEQQSSPAYSPDGRTIAFSGWQRTAGSTSSRSTSSRGRSPTSPTTTSSTAPRSSRPTAGR